MLLGGLWHGAAWTFVVWGALHGALLAATHWVREVKKRRGMALSRATGIRGIVLTLATFHFVALVFVLFRAGSFPVAISVYEHLFDFTTSMANMQPWVVVALLAGYSGHFLPRSLFAKASRLYSLAPAPVQALVLVAFMIVLGRVAGTDVVPFIYFQF